MRRFIGLSDAPLHFALRCAQLVSLSRCARIIAHPMEQRIASVRWNHRRHPREGGDPATLLSRRTRHWIPAFAGMTGRGMAVLAGKAGGGTPAFKETTGHGTPVLAGMTGRGIPAFAGMMGRGMPVLAGKAG